MAEPMTPDEMADIQQRQAYEARQKAQAFLDARNASVATSSPMAPAGPPPPPAKQESWGTAKNAAAKGIIQAGSMFIGGPLVGQAIGAAINEGSDMSGADPGGKPAKPGEWDPRSKVVPPTKDEAALQKASPDRPKPAEGTTYDPVLDMTGESGVDGPPRIVTPAGMRPDSNTVQIHQGRGVPDVTKLAIGEAAKLESEGVEQGRVAEQSYQQDAAVQAQLRADADKAAADAAAAERAQRKQMVDERMARIQSLNDEATSKIDPDKFWHDRGNFARALGVLGSMLGGFGSGLRGGPNEAVSIIENAINRDIDAQKANKQGKRDESSRQMTLLELNMKESDGRLSGIDATKAAYWKTVDTMLQKAAAQRGVTMADANAMQAQAAIARKFGDSMNAVSLQETDDINKVGVEKWQSAVYSGGAGGSGKEHKNVIIVPAFDGSGKQTRVSVHEKDYEPLQQLARATGRLHEINTQAEDARKEYRSAFADWEKDRLNAKKVARVRGLRSDLANLQDARTALSEKQKDPNSAIKEAEYDRAVKVTISYTDGLPGYLAGDKNTDSRIKKNSNQAVSSFRSQLAATGGEVVHPAKVSDKGGGVSLSHVGTGIPYHAPPVSPTPEDSEAP